MSGWPCNETRYKKQVQASQPEDFWCPGSSQRGAEEDEVNTTEPAGRLEDISVSTTDLGLSDWFTLTPKTLPR